MKIEDKMTGSKKLEPGLYTVGTCKIEQKCGRIIRTTDLDAALAHPGYDLMLGRCAGGDEDAGRDFLKNAARQLGVDG